ncbi:DNA methyltransferase 1-associated protein 1 isoform X2 [Zea mays]|uniref:Myb-like domain-containing protein n=1 Tax=Zea mays TaxID=4577 RepID=A0A804PG37_MAIZE|nr:DNA methyltransferase 1-associated protein 1 isoform X2 [Zea mays]|eukprot:XP_020408979.1 DNA methyltransferase 1-associated protein 1 isoform X2 [Zea mays]
MDAKDILGLPKTPFSSSQEKKSRPPKEPQRKPDGVSREVYALTGGVGMPPLMPTIEASHLKRRPAAEKEKVAWQWLPFTSSARTDNLQLYHWVRVVNGIQPTGDYQFAKYNKAWSKEETDQLFELCERFDLRFIVIADRFPTARSVEDLKSRYYSASRALLIHRARSFEDVSGNPLVKDAYDAAHETERKRALSALLSQTKQQERKDAETLAEAKRIMESRAASKNVDVAVMPPNSDNAMVPVDGVSPSSSTHPSLAHPNTSANILIPNSLRTLRVYLRTHALDQMVQAVGASAGLRVIKRVDQTLQELAVNLKPKVPTKAVCIEHIELRNELLTLLNLQKQLQNKEAEVSANRESSFTEAPSTPKRSNRDIDRPFIPDTSGFTGERAGKRDHKRKSTGRFIDAPPSPPQSKRPRKLKGSD